MTEKNTNPKDVIGVTKSPTHLVPKPFLHAVGLALLEGALKYGANNWRVAGVRYSVYYDALQRHLSSWWEGEYLDPDSGLPHIVKAAACLAILFDSTLVGNANDDRPPPAGSRWLGEMNDHARQLVKKYPDPKPPHTARDEPNPSF